jgi:hypothetical protein
VNFLSIGYNELLPRSQRPYQHDFVLGTPTVRSFNSCPHGLLIGKAKPPSDATLGGCHKFSLVFSHAIHLIHSGMILFITICHLACLLSFLAAIVAAIVVAIDDNECECAS